MKRVLNFIAGILAVGTLGACAPQEFTSSDRSSVDSQGISGGKSISLTPEQPRDWVMFNYMKNEKCSDGSDIRSRIEHHRGGWFITRLACKEGQPRLLKSGEIVIHPSENAAALNGVLFQEATPEYKRLSIYCYKQFSSTTCSFGGCSSVHVSLREYEMTKGVVQFQLSLMEEVSRGSDTVRFGESVYAQLVRRSDGYYAYAGERDYLGHTTIALGFPVPKPLSVPAAQATWSIRGRAGMAENLACTRLNPVHSF